MRFLHLLFWSLVAVLALLFLGRNWTDVTVDLWGNLQADVKLPLLLILAFLLGWFPTSAGWRLRHWRLKRSEMLVRQRSPDLSSPQPSPGETPS